jgi:hypothetical protein
VLAGVAALLIGNWTARGRIQAWELGLLGGVLSQFLLIGVTRARFGVLGAADSHYVYVGAIFLLPLVAEAIKRLPWTWAWQPILTGLLLVAVLANAMQLAEQAISQMDLMRTENAELRVVELLRGAPDMSLDTPLDSEIMPQLTARKYLAAVDELGSPIPASTPSSLADLPGDAVDREVLTLFGHALTLNSSGQTPLNTDCHLVDSSVGANLVFSATSSRPLMLRASSSGTALMYLGLMRAPGERPVNMVPLTAPLPEWLHLPDTGQPELWKVRIRTGPIGQLLVCGAHSIQIEVGSSVIDAEGSNGDLGPGWLPTPDPTAFGGLAALLPAGTQTGSFTNDLFGAPTSVRRGVYDVWYRVRVTDASGKTPEMKLGLFDTSSWDWLGASTYPASQLTPMYGWVRVARDVAINPDHKLQFLSQFSNLSSPLSTDWFIDRAVMVESGALPPGLTTYEGQSEAGTSVLSAAGLGGLLGPGWAIVRDTDAIGGHAARLSAGFKTGSFSNDLFGAPTTVPAGRYDLWYRIRVARGTAQRPEMKLGIYDVSERDWMLSKTYSSKQTQSTYAWVRVAAGISPNPNHVVLFLAQFGGPAATSTDWFIDSAALMPTGIPPPAALIAGGE